ncbi:hypothetical protein GQE99_06990 [Maritimibacter sp. DP07]|uniref:Flagellar motor switch protein FliN-like C-terminal domain-containing protein n=1 Tax=Maritimibacter harenae TaxID=2606218 RepID=A0A845M822_9RHOB|nr:FliM/FliN family flagellar motor C-terminal domain-containing protein [Maritimibacter harenae]MZR12764.1 hypothetical protein [Maritimibacter harenae]
MSTETRPSVIRRKAGAGRPPPEIGAPDAAKILRTVVMQAGEEVAGLAIAAGAPEEDRVTLATVTGEMAEHALMALTEGPGGRYGLVLLDRDVLAALIEVQTTGRVTPRPADARAPTRTDAILCADFIDRVLELLEQRAAEAALEQAPALSGYRYALALAEARAIPLTLEDVPYRRFRMSLDMARGAKQGRLDLILPFDAAPTAGAGAGLADGAGFTRRLGEVVAGAPVRLRAMLHRVEMPIAQVTELRAGSMIPLPAGALDNVTVADLDGRPVAQGRLGMADGNRAVRLGTAGESRALPREAPPTPPQGQGAQVPDLPVQEGDLPDLDTLPDLGDLPGDSTPIDLDALGDLGDLGNDG